MNPFKYQIAILFFLIIVSCTPETNEPIEEEVAKEGTADTTAPEVSITLNNLSSDATQVIVVGNEIVIDVDATDANGIEKIEAFIDGDKVAEDLEAPYQIIIDLSNYTSKGSTGASKINAYNLLIVATDVNGNTTSVEQQFTISNNALITINFPEGFYDNFTDRMYVFASDKLGNLLDSKRILPETRSVILQNTDPELEEPEYSITFALYNSGIESTYTDLYTIIDVHEINQINLRVPLRTNQLDARYLPTSGFDEFDLYNTYGSSAFGSGQLQESPEGVKNGEFRILRRFDMGPENLSIDKIYIALDNITLNTYKYAVLDWDLQGISEIREDMFTDEGVERRRYESEVSNANHQHTTLMQYGYFNDNEFENNIYRYDRGQGYGGGISPSSFFYYHNSIFFKRRYDLTMNDQFISAIGDPQAYYPKL